MPSTKSAMRRMRSTARKQARNRTIKSEIGTLERQYARHLQARDKDKAAAALREVYSAMDKAAKRGVMHWAAASRKKSRLGLRLNALA